MTLISTLATIGSLAIVVILAVWWAALGLRAEIRREGRNVISALKHDSEDLRQLRVDVAALRATLITETAATDALVRSARRHLHVA